MRKISDYTLIFPITLAVVLSAAFAGCCSARRSSNAFIPTAVSAAINNDLKQLKELDASGADLNFQEPGVFGWTPLIAAVYHENTDVAAYLLNRGVDVNRQDLNGDTALIWAVNLDQTNVVQWLLEKGADPMIQNRVGTTALSYAKGSPQMTSLLESALRTRQHR